MVEIQPGPGYSSRICSSEPPIRVRLQGPPPGSLGGVQRHVTDLSAALLRAGTPLCAPHTPADILHLNPSLRWRAVLRDALHARRALHDGQRVVAHIHGWSDRLAAGFARARVDGLVGPCVRLVTLTEARRQQLLAWGVPAHRTAVIGPCARSWDLAPRDPDGPLLFLGRLVRAKGAHHLLAAAGPREVVIAGDGPDRARLEHLAQQLGTRARFVGWQTDIEPLLAACSAVVLPSYDEGLPICLLEALGSGRPVVATAVGGVPELIGDAAIPPGDEEALRRALGQITDVPDATKQAIRARYAPDAVAAQFVAVYEDLMRSP